MAKCTQIGTNQNVKSEWTATKDVGRMCSSNVDILGTCQKLILNYPTQCESLTILH